MTCGVCAKHLSMADLPGGVIYQNDFIFIAHFPFQTKPHFGHLILELKRHITSPALMNEAEATAVGMWQQRMSDFLETELGAKHTYLFRIGDITPHLHFHAVPRFENTPKEIWGISLYQSPLGRKADVLEIKKFSDQMRSWILKKTFSF